MRQLETLRPPGRPRIGRHMQTRVPDDHADWIEREAARRGEDVPEFFREVIAAGVETLRADAA
jgi:hypothetical protein